MMKPAAYKIILWIMAALLLVGLFACASGKDDKASDTAPVEALSDSARIAGATGSWKLSRPMRLMLGGSSTHDSVAVATDLFVDLAIGRVLDSIPSTDYVPLRVRDSIASDAIKKGEMGISLADIGSLLRLDGAIYTKIARFGSVLGVDLQIVDPKTRAVLYKNLSFSYIRYRDSSDAMLIAPPLYDAIRKALGGYFGAPHTASAPVAGEGLLISGITIDKLPALGQISARRETLTRDVVKALAEYAVRHFPEIVPLDRPSRDGLYGMFGLQGVTDYEPMLAEERKILFNVGIDRFLAGRVEPVGDSVRLALEIRSVVSATRDSLVDASSRTYGRFEFESSTVDEDFVVAFIDVAEPLFEREAARVREAYSKRVGK